MKIPHPIPYQGSKRNLAKYILPFFPEGVRSLVEPFAGSAAISIAAAVHRKVDWFHLNDINQPLMTLWYEIIHHPAEIAAAYERLWREQQTDARVYYDRVREMFNRTGRAEYLLYLLARCVKASVRYNAEGGFNQSPDNRRLGRHPARMREDIFAVSRLFRGRTTLTCKDYREVLAQVTPDDLVYMDPPYQGVCTSGDPRYLRGVDYEEFVRELQRLNERGICFILSYDGRTGERSHGRRLPAELGLHRLEVEAGRSSQATLLGRSEVTYESVYLSHALIRKLHLSPQKVTSVPLEVQPALFELS